MQRTLFAAQNLLSHGIKAIVVACNTATAAAIALLRTHYPELIIIGVEPALKPAAAMTRTGQVGDIATTSTLASAKYQLLCAQIQQTTQVHFISQACPGLVNQIELGELDSPATLKILRNCLQAILQSQADILVLGCTHYPFIETSIRSIAASENKGAIHILDTGQAIARQLQRLLTQQQLVHHSPSTARLRFITSGTSEKLEFALTRLLNLDAAQYVIQEIRCNLPAS